VATHLAALAYDTRFEPEAADRLASQANESIEKIAGWLEWHRPGNDEREHRMVTEKLVANVLQLAVKTWNDELFVKTARWLRDLRPKAWPQLWSGIREDATGHLIVHPPISPPQLAGFICKLARREDDGGLVDTLREICLAVSKIKGTATFRHFWFPFFGELRRSLTSVIQEDRLSATVHHEMKRLASVVLESHLRYRVDELEGDFRRDLQLVSLGACDILTYLAGPSVRGLSLLWDEGKAKFIARYLREEPTIELSMDPTADPQIMRIKKLSPEKPGLRRFDAELRREAKKRQLDLEGFIPDEVVRSSDELRFLGHWQTPVTFFSPQDADLVKRNREDLLAVQKLLGRRNPQDNEPAPEFIGLDLEEGIVDECNGQKLGPIWIEKLNFHRLGFEKIEPKDDPVYTKVDGKVQKKPEVTSEGGMADPGQKNLGVKRPRDGGESGDDDDGKQAQAKRVRFA